MLITKSGTDIWRRVERYRQDRSAVPDPGGIASWRRRHAPEPIAAAKRLHDRDRSLQRPTFWRRTWGDGGMDQRFLDVAQLIAAQPLLSDVTGPMDRIRRLCRAATGPLRASGVGITVMGEGLVRGMVAGSDTKAEQLEELQFTVGEGPCVDAFAHRRPVLIPDLDASATARWPGYTPAAYALGVRAVFAFPLQIGASRLGVLDVFRERAVMLSGAELTLAFTFAEVALSTLLRETLSPTPAGAGGDAHDDLLGARAEVFQAQGMVTGQLGVNLADALARMRAHAYLHDLRLGDVATDIVAGRLHLEHHPNDHDHPAETTDPGGTAPS